MNIKKTNKTLDEIIAWCKIDTEKYRVTAIHSRSGIIRKIKLGKVV